MAMKPMPAPQPMPPQESADSMPGQPAFGTTVRDSKGKFPSSLNVGGTMTSKKHPSTRHFKD
jgi:hypothetical protein